MLIPTGHSAYFNVQGTDVAGAGTDSWQCNVFANTDGTLLADGPGAWRIRRPSRTTSGSMSASWWTSNRTSSRCGLMVRRSWTAYWLQQHQFLCVGRWRDHWPHYLDSITLAESDVDLVNVEEEAAQAFGFLPNPSNGQLRLSGVQSQTTLVVLDLMGREVLSESLDAGQQSVQLDLPEGVYLIGTDNQKNLRKLVIRR